MSMLQPCGQDRDGTTDAIKTAVEYVLREPSGEKKKWSRRDALLGPAPANMSRRKMEVKMRKFSNWLRSHAPLPNQHDSSTASRHEPALDHRGMADRRTRYKKEKRENPCVASARNALSSVDLDRRRTR